MPDADKKCGSINSIILLINLSWPSTHIAFRGFLTFNVCACAQEFLWFKVSLQLEFVKVTMHSGISECISVYDQKFNEILQPGIIYLIADC